MEVEGVLVVPLYGSKESSEEDNQISNKLQANGKPPALYM